VASSTSPRILLNVVLAVIAIAIAIAGGAIVGANLGGAGSDSVSSSVTTIASTTSGLTTIVASTTTQPATTQPATTQTEVPPVMTAETARAHTVSGTPTSVDVRPDGIVAVGTREGKIAFVDDGGEFQTIDASTGAIRDVTFGPTGDLVAAGADRSIRVWRYDAARGEFSPAPALDPEGDEHASSIGIVVWSPDGAIIASGSDDSTVGLWDARSLAPLPRSRAHDFAGAVTDVQFARGWIAGDVGTHEIAVSTDSGVFWVHETDQNVEPLPIGQSVKSAAMRLRYLGDDGSLVGVDQDEAHRWPADRSAPAPFTGPAGSQIRVIDTWSRGGAVVLVAAIERGESHILAAWMADSDQLPVEVSGFTYDLVDVAIAEDGSRAAVVDNRNALRVVELHTSPA
jgi:hypothetical protein